MKKKYIREKVLIQDSFKLAIKIFNSQFKPDFLVGLWRGGSTVGIYVQECLQHLGVQTDHISIRTSYQGEPDYRDRIEKGREIRAHGLQYLLENLNHDQKLLIVDDVYGSGSSIKAVIKQLSERLKKNMPSNYKVAVPWYKPSQNTSGRVPDFYVHETDEWLVLPYELVGLEPNEIVNNKPGVSEILSSIRVNHNLD